jgi:hypothetical protein
MNQHSFRDLELEVLRWSEARRIIPRSNPAAQSRKAAEECAEMLDAAARLQMLEELKHTLPLDVYLSARSYQMDKFRDGCGDVVVCLLNACALADVDLVTCLAGAYNEIKTRTGTMNEAGIFVKDK